MEKESMGRLGSFIWESTFQEDAIIVSEELRFPEGTTLPSSPAQ